MSASYSVQTDECREALGRFYQDEDGMLYDTALSRCSPDHVKQAILQVCKT